MNILTVLFFLIAGAAYAIKTAVLFRYQDTPFKNFSPKWWNPDISHLNKWKNGDPSQGEKFPLSSTVLVGFTDAFHFFQSLTVTFVAAAAITEMMGEVLSLKWIMFVLLLKAAFTIPFELGYRLITGQSLFTRPKPKVNPIAAKVAEFGGGEVKVKKPGFWATWKGAITFAAVGGVGLLVISHINIGVIGAVAAYIIVAAAAFVVSRLVGS